PVLPALDDCRELGGVPRLLGEVALGDHAVHDVVPARLRGRRVLRPDTRVEIGRTLDDPGQQGTLLDGDLADRLAEVGLAGGRDARGTPTVVDGVEVVLE